MHVPGCPYCEKNEKLFSLAIEVAKLSTSTLYLMKEQSHPGRVMVAHDDHVSEVVDLDDAQRAAYFDDIVRAARALHAAFKPGKVNYAAFGDTVRHMHYHLVPKYEGEFEWGETFVMNPQKTYLSEAEYQDMIEKIRKAL